MGTEFVISLVYLSHNVLIKSSRNWLAVKMSILGCKEFVLRVYLSTLIHDIVQMFQAVIYKYGEFFSATVGAVLNVVRQI